MEVPIMKQAIDAYHHITVTPEFREAERLREMARHNEAAALRNAEQKGQKKVQKEIIDLLKNGKSPEEIIREYDTKL